MPSFSYCFKKSTGRYELFDRATTPARVGVIAELFRKAPGVVRTSSPTHSFSLWGEVQKHIAEDNAPESPLGAGSVMEWLAEEPHAHLLLLGVDFSSLSFCHYIEIEAKVPWYDYSPWGYLHVENIGVSIAGEQRLREIPGCSRGFIKFEQYLADRSIIKPDVVKDLKSYYLPVSLLLKSGVDYFRNNASQLLCPPRNCQACDARRAAFKLSVRNP